MPTPSWKRFHIFFTLHRELGLNHKKLSINKNIMETLHESQNATQSIGAVSCPNITSKLHNSGEHE
ncbi:hypothetical protein VAEKB19_5200059 [Vibrio aestuarianus]|nr:hypothetical protein VAEKB19_5200059 [Vibrio aestuarianus]